MRRHAEEIAYDGETLGSRRVREAFPAHSPHEPCQAEHERRSSENVKSKGSGHRGGVIRRLPPEGNSVWDAPALYGAMSTMTRHVYEATRSNEKDVSVTVDCV
jgi:hypothetical protein